MTGNDGGGGAAPRGDGENAVYLYDAEFLGDEGGAPVSCGCGHPEGADVTGASTSADNANLS